MKKILFCVLAFICVTAYAETFTSVEAFVAWLDTQRTNTAAAPYAVELKVSTLSFSANPGRSIGSVFRFNTSTKYVNCQ
jgi:hypothetical protein